MITITEQEFLNYTGINLSLEIPDKDDSANKVERTILLWTKRIYRLMTKPIREDGDMSDYQVECIKDAICEYGAYYFKNGDLFRLSGFDEDKGQLIMPSEIDKIKVPHEVYNMLNDCGLIRKNISRRTRINQNIDDIYW